MRDKRLHLALTSTTITALVGAMLAPMLVVAPAAAATGAVTITSPAEGSSSLVGGVPFSVSADANVNAEKVTLSASGCAFTPSVFTPVTAGSTLSATASCSAGLSKASVTAKAILPDGTTSTTTRAITFDNTASVTPALSVTRQLLPLCTGKGTFIAHAQTPGGQPIMGLPVTGVTPTGSRTTKTNAAGDAVFTLTLADGAALVANSSQSGQYAAASSPTPADAGVDTCQVTTTVDTSPASSVTYLTPVTVSGHVYLERTSDQARMPLAAQTVTVTHGGAKFATAKTNAAGEWTVLKPIVRSGRWVATATTTLATVANKTGTGAGGSTTLRKYQGTITPAAPVPPKVGYFTAGSTARTTIDLDTKNPDSLENSDSVAKGVLLKSIYRLAGQSGGTLLSSSIRTGDAGIAKVGGTIGGTGSIGIQVTSDVYGVSSSEALIDISARARVRTSLSATSFVPNAKAKILVSAFPLTSGNATIEMKPSASETWTTLTTVPIDVESEITIPGPPGKYHLRAVTDATTIADAGSSKPVGITVSSEVSGATVTDLSCASTAGANPVCTWGPAVTLPGQTVTGYIVKAGALTIAELTANDARTVTVPTTATKPGDTEPTTIIKPGSPVRVTVTPTVDVDAVKASPAVKATVLATPTTVTPVIRGTSVTLTWPKVKGADENYLISVDGGAPRSTLGTGYVFEGLTPFNHSFELVSRTQHGDTSAPFSFSLASAGTVPGAPAWLTATPSNGTIDLVWEEPSDGGVPIGDYTIEYRADGGAWVTLADGLSTDASATITGLTNGTSYDVRVSATNLIGTGAWSPIRTAMPRSKPSQPQALTASGTIASVQLSWQRPSSDGGASVTGYVVYRQDGSTWVTLGTTTSLTFVDATAPVGVLSTYRVTALNAAGESNPATATATASLPLAISYASSQFSRNQSGQVLTPVVTGGVGALSYSLSGTLPTGVTFNTSTGALTGPNLYDRPEGYPNTSFAYPAGALNATGVTALASGAVIAYGTFTTWNGTPASKIVKLGSDGARDTTFDANIGTASGAGAINSVVEQADGKLVVGFTATSWNGASARYIVRLNSDGTRDASFDANVGTGANGSVLNIVSEAGGSLLVQGTFSTFNGTTSGGLARLSSNGVLDTAFAANMPTSAAGVNHLAVLPSGKILLGGTMSSWKGSASRNAIRLNSDGTRDASFDANIGTAASAAILNVAAQSDGKVILAGQFATWNGVTVNGVVRLNSDGTRDTAFSTNTGTATGGTSKVTSVIVDSTGRITLGGYFASWDGDANQRYLIRLLPSGALDPAFGDVAHYSYAATGNVEGLSLTPSGQVAAVGAFQKMSNVSLWGFGLTTDGGPAPTPGFPASVSVTVSDSGTGLSSSVPLSLTVAAP